MNRKVIVLVAHDAKKTDILEWAGFNRETLKSFKIYATQTTGQILQDKLGLNINLLKSGPLGGDAQVATMIVEGKVDILVFFWDPLTPQPHDVDVKALLRLAVLYNIPIACNRSTADYIISSPLVNLEVTKSLPEL
ncbi:MAG TPA: methylglyoxal synthase [Candidatus Limnocylindrales bacterium]|nr:methylglyoxal synthase [Candidatus Limnocylindrales bacterium]